LGEGRFRTLLPTCNAVFVGWNFFVEGEKNLRVISGAVNPRILCKLHFYESSFRSPARRGKLEDRLQRRLSGAQPCAKSECNLLC